MGTLLACAAIALIAGCSSPPTAPVPRRPEDVRAQIVRLMPARVPDRAGWAVDIYAAFAAQKIEPSTQNLCAALSVIDQESGYNANDAVPGLARIARTEIDRRAGEHHIPLFLVHAALLVKSPDGKSYDERLAAVRSEQDMSRIYEDLIGSLPMGKRLFEGDNPVRTAGPMQVGIAFAAQHLRGYPYPRAAKAPVRDEVFTRRGGVYFGIAHLLGYRTSYPQMLYRFADYNAGQYASRNAAFQQAVALASGIPIALDGDVVRPDGNGDGATELALRTLGPSLQLGDAQIHRALQQGDAFDFEASSLYERVFALADKMGRRHLARAVVPKINLASPKITRKLTTEWYASRVNQRYVRCLALDRMGKGKDSR